MPFRIFRGLPALFLLCLACLPARADMDYPPQVSPVVENRCMVCHGCYDAPCQLKLDAWAGVQRGASKDKVYDGTRLLTANLTRLFDDASDMAGWRDKGFYPVLDEEQPAAGVMARMLDLKRQHPLPAGDILPDSFDLSLDRNQQCPQGDEFDDFASDYPLWGMPYAMPALSDADHATLSDWLQAGAPGVATPPPGEAERAALQQWEKFFNGSSLKEQLMSRYIYEHLFIGALYFADLPDSRYYELVRSRTPPGQPIDIIATRRPYDPPGTESFFYRLRPARTVPLAKRHMPYALDAARMARWRELFLAPQYTVSELPSYSTRVASNPFVAFRELPQLSRYQFMLDEAQFTIMGFIKGPVCRGQVALNVIDDHFWVVFIDPDDQSAQSSAEFLARESGNLRMPSGDSGLLVSLVDWRKYAKNQLQFLKAKMDFVARQVSADDVAVDLGLVWDGDGNNDNASLTIFRHNDSATVVKGLVGRYPKTGWVIDYSLLERIHYLLVAGFDVYGNAGHQLETRLYMDFLRMEGEQNFLLFLPEAERLKLRDYWYRGAGKHAKKYVLGDSVAFDRDTDIEYHSDNHKVELMDMLKQRQYGAQAAHYRVDNAALQRLARQTGANLSYMPEVAFLDVLHKDGRSSVYSLVHTNGFSNNAQLFKEEQRRRPDEDYVVVVSGFIGAYPNVFFQLPESDLAPFVDAVAALDSDADYAALVSRYGVRRSAPWFWSLSDKLRARYAQERPLEAGLFDLNRYENR